MEIWDCSRCGVMTSTSGTYPISGYDCEGSEFGEFVIHLWEKRDVVPEAYRLAVWEEDKGWVEIKADDLLSVLTK